MIDAALTLAAALTTNQKLLRGRPSRGANSCLRGFGGQISLPRPRSRAQPPPKTYLIRLLNDTALLSSRTHRSE